MLLHKGIERTPLFKTEESAHLVCPNIQLTVGQAFKSGITGNLFFTDISDFFFFNEFLILLTLISLPIFCCHAIIQVQDKHQTRSFSQQSSETGTTDQLQAEKIERDLQNITHQALFLILYRYTIQYRTLIVK